MRTDPSEPHACSRLIPETCPSGEDISSIPAAPPWSRPPAFRLRPAAGLAHRGAAVCGRACIQQAGGPGGAALDEEKKL